MQRLHLLIFFTICRYFCDALVIFLFQRSIGRFAIRNLVITTLALGTVCQLIYIAAGLREVIFIAQLYVGEGSVDFRLIEMFAVNLPQIIVFGCIVTML